MYIFDPQVNVLIGANINTYIPNCTSWSNKNISFSSWVITPLESGDFCIIMPSKRICLDYNDNQVKIQPIPLSNGDVQTWRILIDFDGNHVIIPKECEYSNYALKCNSTGVFIGNYYDIDYTVGWRIVPKTFYIDNYYDSSFDLEESVIITANEFVRDYAFWGTGFSLDYSDSISYRTDFLADQCSNGNAQACDESCGTGCSTHHKDYVHILVDLHNKAGRRDNHISFLWADRVPSAYCGYSLIQENGRIYENYALGAQLKSVVEYENEDGSYTRYTERVPVATSFTISDFGITLSDSKIEAIAATTFAHETAHVLYMYEAYKNPDHSEENGTYCIMNYVNFNTIEYLYNGIIDGDIDPFCQTCCLHLNENAGRIIYIDEYEHLNGIYEIVEGE